MNKLILAIFMGCCLIACGERNSDDTADQSSTELLGDSGSTDPEVSDAADQEDVGVADVINTTTDVSYVEFDAVDVTASAPDSGE